MGRWRRCWALVAACALLAGACGDDGDGEPTAAVDGIRVASFDFAESELLAELYAQALEAEGLPVVRLGPIGPREIVAPALEIGQIDVVPEYLGTALQYIGAPDPNPDTESALADLSDRLEERGLTPLAASRAEDKNVIVVTAERARRDDLEDISDLARYADELRFGGPAECRDRPLCLLGLNRVYGLSFAEFVPQRSLEFTAEALRRGEIDVGLMFSTAAELETSDLVVLNDDRGLQPAENLVPIVRTEALEIWGPELASALDAMAPLLTTTELRLLNASVARGLTVESVARAWLLRMVLI